MSHPFPADFVGQVIRFRRTVRDLPLHQLALLQPDAGLHQHAQRQRLAGSGCALNEERGRRVGSVRQRGGDPNQVGELMVVELSCD